MDFNKTSRVSYLCLVFASIIFSRSSSVRRALTVCPVMIIRFMSGPKNESDILTGSSTPNRFLLVSLAVIQAIYKHCISKCFFVSIDQFCRKQFTKLANLLMHSQCALSEPISSSRKTRKLTVCRFI